MHVATHEGIMLVVKRNDRYTHEYICSHIVVVPDATTVASSPSMHSKPLGPLSQSFSRGFSHDL